MSFSLLGFSHLGQGRGINEDTKKRHKVQGWERLAAEVWNCRAVKLLCRHALPSAVAGEPWMPSLLFTITFIHLPFRPTLCLCCVLFFEGFPSLYNHNDNLACLVFMVVWLYVCYQTNKRSSFLLLFGGQVQKVQPSNIQTLICPKTAYCSPAALITSNQMQGA